MPNVPFRSEQMRGDASNRRDDSENISENIFCELLSPIDDFLTRAIEFAVRAVHDA